MGRNPGDDKGEECKLKAVQGLDEVGSGRSPPRAGNPNVSKGTLWNRKLGMQ